MGDYFFGSLRESPAHSQSSRTPRPPAGNSGTTLPTDIAALHSVINTLQAGLNTTTTANTNLATSVTRLQAELENVTTAVTQLAVSVTRLQAGQAILTPTTTATTSATTSATTTPTPTMPSTPTTTTAPLPFPHPEQPRTTPCGRGAASPEVFQDIIKTNWHSRLGRVHMVDVDALPASALKELDCLLRRKLHAILPRSGPCSAPESDIIYASLAALGLRLEDRGDYADLPVKNDNLLHNESTVRRGRNLAAWHLTRDEYAEYWKGFVFETLIELARYRGLFDEEGFLRTET